MVYSTPSLQHIKASSVGQYTLLVHAPAGQYDDAQACPLLNASDEPPDASSSLTGQEPVAFAVAVTLPKNLKAADRALKGWQKHKLALWLYMIVGAMVICSSVQNSFAPSILPAALGIGIAMWGLLFLTWTPDMQLHSVDELLQARKPCLLRVLLAHC